MLVIVVLFIILGNLKQVNYWKILFLKIVGIYKKYSLTFSQFFKIFLLSVYKMVDIIDINRSSIDILILEKY